MEASKIYQINELVKELEKENQEISETDKQIYALVYQLYQSRREQKITQKKLSEITGVSPNTISRIETYLTTPSLPVLIRIVNALNMSITLSPKL